MNNVTAEPYKTHSHNSKPLWLGFLTRLVVGSVMVLLFVVVLLVLFASGVGSVQSITAFRNSAWVWGMRYLAYVVFWLLFPRILRAKGFSANDISGVRRPVIIGVVACEAVIILNTLL